jgi:hypothetical protein
VTESSPTEPAPRNEQAEPLREGAAVTAYDAGSDDVGRVADPRVRDAVRRLDVLSDLPPAEHVEVYEAVHSSLQESLAEATRQADESPADRNPHP